MSVTNKDFKYEPAHPDISPRAKGKLNDKNYRAYVKFLKKHKLKFPSNDDGDVNIKAVAEICGFERQVFYVNKTLKPLLTENVIEIGTELVEGRDPSGALSEEVVELRKQLNDAKRDLALTEEEKEGLEKQLMEARKTIRQLEKNSAEEAESLEHIIETGRRFTL